MRVVQQIKLLVTGRALTAMDCPDGCLNLLSENDDLGGL